MRTFETGATRDTDAGKNDYEGFLSPLVLQAYGDYMTIHRKQADGKLRDSDNWQKGIPVSTYMKSLWRHFLDVWSLHRGIARKDDQGAPLSIETALCACLFNVMGYLHEVLKQKALDKKVLEGAKVVGSIESCPHPHRLYSARDGVRCGECGALWA